VSEKGLKAVMLNEDTSHTTDSWIQVQTTAQLAYMSPEMVLSTSFQRLWKDSNFRGCLTALVIDEAHCIEEWGGIDFQPQYRQLDILRTYTGQEVPILACTGTCRTSTFNLIWDTLGYGYRPFWGLDVGTERPNLYFIVRPLSEPKNPLLEILNLLPKVLDRETALDGSTLSQAPSAKAPQAA